MSSKWHKDFQERVAKIGVNGQVGANRYGQVNPLLGIVSNANPYAVKNSEPNTITERMGSIASNALDLISRPGYATGGFLNSLLEDIVDDKPGVDVGEAFSRAGQGFAGQQKEFFNPWEIIDPHRDDDNYGRNIGRGVTDFLASVLTDPLTYIPGAALIKGYQTAGKVTGLNKAGKAIKAYSESKPNLRVGAGNTNEQISLSSLEQADQQADALANTVNLKTGNKWTPNAPEKPPVVSEPKNPQDFVNAVLNDAEVPQPKVDELADLTNPALSPESPFKIPETGRETIKSRTLDYMNDPRSQEFIASLQKDLRAVPVGADKYGIRLGALTLLRSSVADTLANIRGKYFTPGDLRSPWKEELVKVDIPAPERPSILDEQLVKPSSVLEDIPDAESAAGDLSAIEAARLNAITRHLIDNPKTIKLKGESIGRGAEISKTRKYKNRDVYDPSTKTWYYNGEEVDFPAWAKESGLLTDEGFAAYAKPVSEDTGKQLTRSVIVHPFDEKHPLYRNTRAANIDTARKAGNALMPMEQYARMLLEPVKKEMDDVLIAKRGTPVSFNEYVQSRQTKWNARKTEKTTGKREVPPSAEAMAEYEKKVAAQAKAKEDYDKAIKAYEDEVAAFDKQVKRVAPTTEERMAWVQAHSETIPAKELKALAKAMEKGDEAAFNKVAKKLMDAEKKLDIATLEELDDAVKAGRVSKEELDRVLAELGARNISDAKRKMASLEKAIEKAKGQVDTDADLLQNMPPKIRKNAMLVEKAMRNAPKQYKPIPPVGVKMGDLRNMRLKRNTPERQKFMRDMYADALSAVVNPETYAKLSPAQIERVGDHLVAMAAREFENPAHWKYRTKGGAQAATPRPYDGGKRRWLQEYNDRPQYTYWKNLLSDVNEQAKTMMKAGELKPGHEFNKFKREQVLPVLLATEDVLRAYGMQPSLWPGGRGIALSWGDVITSMGDSAQLNYVFNMNKQITQDQLFRIAERALEHVDTIDDAASLDGFAGFVREVLEEGDDLAKEARYSTSAKQSAQFAKRNTLKKATQAALAKYGPDVPGNIQKQILNKSEAIYEKEMKAAVEAIANPEFVRSIAEKVARNSAQAEIQSGEFVGKFSNELIQKFLDDVGSITTPDEIFALVDNARKGVRGFVKENADIVPPPHSVETIHARIEGQTLNFGTELAKKTVQMYEKAGTPAAMNDVSYQAIKATEDWINANILDNPSMRQMVDVVNLSDGIELGYMGNIIFQTFPHLQTKELRNLFLNSQNFGRLLSEQFSRRLSTFERKYGKAEAKVIFDDLRNGVEINKSPAHKELSNIIAQIFDVAGSGYGPLQRHGLDPKHINANLKHFGIDDAFQLKGKDRKAAFDSWLNWPSVNEPLDLLSKYHAAVQKTLMEKQFGSIVSYKFGSKTYKEGYVRVAAPKGGSRMAHLIDTRLYYPPEVAEAMRFMDKTLAELAKPRSTNAFWKIFDTLTHKLKSGLTIYRPGHHMRNMFGDVWLTAMDGIYDPRVYTTAWDVMRSRTRFYSEDIRDMMRRAGELDFDGSKGTAVTIKINGKDVSLSHDTIYRLMYRNGGLPGYATIEDLTVGSTFGQAEKVTGKVSLSQPFAGRVHDSAVRISEYRDHYVRIAHFIGLLKRGKITGKKLPNETQDQFVARMLDGFTQEAAIRIRKFHPDGGDLTQFERDVAKRGVLFYSWIRKMVPQIMQMYFIQPGRFLMFPKAMYSMAEANGIDLNGFTDPFPTDQLFPAWMGATQGPIAGNQNDGYIGMKMGIPQMDIMDQYFTNPGETLQTFGTSLNPAIRIPTELFFGETAQGVPIKDTAKYLLGQVPYGNLANTTAGGFNRLAGGEGNPIGETTPADVGYNPGGFRDPVFLAWLNTMTGLGFQDMSKPSYQKSAEFDVKYGRITQ